MEEVSVILNKQYVVMLCPNCNTSTLCLVLRYNIWECTECQHVLGASYVCPDIIDTNPDYI